MSATIIEQIGHRFCMYLRKSRADILKELEMGDGYDALAHHEQALLDFAARIGATISETYREMVSAESIEDRAEMQRLLEDIESGMWDGVFVVEVERLCRGSKKDQGEVGEAFVDNEVFILTPQKIYDPMDESDMEYFDFGLFMSRREYLTIRRRLLGGKLNHARAGEYIGRIAPFGYDKVRKAGLKTLEPNECAKYVKMMFDWYANDSLGDGETSLGGIAAEMTKMGVPSPSGKEEWSRDVIRYILQNDHYLGKVRWMNIIVKKKKVTDPKGRRKKRKVPVKNDSPHIFPGLHEPLVDQETFDKVQARFKANLSTYPRTREKRNHYAGLIRCAQCGVTLSYDNHRDAPYMVHRGKGGCVMKSCKLSNLDALVTAFLKSEAENLEIAVRDERQEDRIALYEAEKARLEAEIANSRRIMMENADRLESGVYTDEMYLERNALHERKIKNAQEAIRKMVVPTSASVCEKIVTVHECIDALADPEFDVVAKNVLLKSVIKEIRYTNRGSKGDDSQMVLDIELT